MWTQHLSHRPLMMDTRDNPTVLEMLGSNSLLTLPIT
jgi:hypothetical protein